MADNQKMRLKRASSMVRKIDENFSTRGSLAVLTSGGDCQGMNAALRSVVRTCLFKKVPVYAVMEGYEGLIEGGDCIKPMNWGSVSNIMDLGGTIIGTARSERFRTEEGRYLATVNLLKKNISNLIIIGGDGSLTGGDIFQSEWEKNVKKAISAGDLGEEFSHRKLKIIGIVGSIDNDFVNNPMTIGTDSALNRICESIDSIEDTAGSHQRAFVVEVMGRNCGYLAITASVCCVADYVLLPEVCWSDNWQQHMSKCIIRNRKEGRRTTIVVVAEGALDRSGKLIESSEVYDVLKNNLKLDTRITVLGHVQRGGRPSAFDRLMASRIGCDAVLTMMSVNYTEPMIISIRDNSTLLLPMVESINCTRKIGSMLKNCEFDKLLEIRGNYFQNYIKAYQTLSRAILTDDNIRKSEMNIAIIHHGRPVSGMNTATAVIVRYFIEQGYGVKGVKKGIRSLMKACESTSPLVVDLRIKDTHGLANKPGSILGTKLSDFRKSKHEFDAKQLNRTLKSHNIRAIVVMGDNTTIDLLKDLDECRGELENPDMPIIMIPFSSSNDITGTRFSIGSDTCINQTVSMIDNLRYNNSGHGKCLNFVVLQGTDSSYVPLITSIASGVTRCYTSQDRFELHELCDHARQYSEESEIASCGIIICTDDIDDKSSLSVDNLIAIYQKQLRGSVSCLRSNLGQFQFGAKPSPFDRKLATKLALETCDEILRLLNVEKSGNGDGKSYRKSRLLAYMNGKGEYLPVDSLKQDAMHGSSSFEWWSFLQSLVKILGDERGDTDYDPEIEY